MEEGVRDIVRPRPADDWHEDDDALPRMRADAARVPALVAERDALEARVRELEPVGSDPAE